MKLQIYQTFRRLTSYILHGIPIQTYSYTKPNIFYLASSQKLLNKKIVITGGGGGIGFAMARKFKSEGAEILIAGRSEEKLKKSADELGCDYLCLDVRNISTFDDFIRNAYKKLNGLNCLVNNAGISLHEDSFTSVSEEQYDSQFDVNLKGSFFLTQSFMKYCKERNIDDTKNILFISSETGMTVDERPYGLTKVAMNSLVQGLAHKYVNDKFRINAIAPGVTVTDMIGIKAYDDLTCDYNITKRYYLPEEVAEVACFLLSDVSNCLNGQILVCNEGKTINARWR